MKNEQPSMLKIAHRAQVSAMTVSRVLNHSAAVSESTRAKVLQIAGEMGYRHYPNAISRMLRGERSRSIGVLACFARPHLAGEAMHRIGKVLFDSDYVSYIVDTYSDPAVTLRALKTLAERRAEGVIYYTYNREAVNEDISRLLRQIGSAVIITLERQTLPFHQIYCGWDPGVREVVRYFAACGSRCPVMLKESRNEECCRVFESACRESGFRRWKVVTCSSSRIAESPEFRKGLPGDAIFCSSEHFRQFVLERTDGGRSIPVTMLLDDFLISQLRPDYPVLRRREPEAGTAAVKLLMDQIDGRQTEPVTVSLPMQFMEKVPTAFGEILNEETAIKGIGR